MIICVSSSVVKKSERDQLLSEEKKAILIAKQLFFNQMQTFALHLGENVGLQV